MAVSGKKLASCNSGKNNTLSLLHSSKEKLRRERIKNCCEQLRALLPHGKERKDDVASVLEATVEYMRYLQDRLPRDITSQIAKILQNNRRFSKERLMPKDSAPLLFSPEPRNNAASIKVLDRSGEKTGLSTKKTKGSLCSTAADCCPTEWTSTCQHYETAQPDCCMPVLYLPVKTPPLRLPSLFYNVNAVQDSTTLLVNPNNVSSSVPWLQSHNESDFHIVDCKGCSQSLPFTQHLLFPWLCKSICGTKSAIEFPDI